MVCVCGVVCGDGDRVVHSGCGGEDKESDVCVWDGDRVMCGSDDGVLCGGGDKVVLGW